MASPALERYTNGLVRGDLWKRPDLSPRDRSIVTLAALIARNQTVELPYYLDLAIDSGVKPAEVSEMITHLAFYSGWGNAVAAADVMNDVFGRRQIGADQLAPASPRLLPLDKVAEEKWAANVAQMPFHLTKAMDNGLTRTQAAEVITHLAFYVGWPNAMSALPVAKEVFEKRPR
jgi:4-carboxymuconolactone decarboxylase